MDRSRFVIAMIAVAVFTLAMAGTAFAAPEAYVNGEVDVKQYSVVLDAGSAQIFGQLSVGEQGSDTFGSDIVVRNAGSTTSNWFVTGSDASNGSTIWELCRTGCGPDMYQWYWENLTDSTSLYLDDESVGIFAERVAPGESRTVRTTLIMPTSTSGIGVYDMQATIWAVAP